MNFLFFFIILIFGFSMIITILGLGNISIDGNFKTIMTKEGKLNDYPGMENKLVGMLLGNFFYVWRCA